ncbi:MAG: hypothetical protein Kow0029_02230 [Candidatus Rifleibacteriota bacterium]
MNQYLLLLGPAMGFALGVFFTWFLTYARMRQVEKTAAEERKQLESRLEQGKENEKELARLSSKLEDSQNLIAGLKKQIDEKSSLLIAEREKNSALEERIRKIEILEKVVNELKGFENEVVALREKNQNYETNLSEKKEQIQQLQKEVETLKAEVHTFQKKAEAQAERLRELAVIKERARKLEEENSNLLKENEQLRNIEAQLRQINEIKEMYGRTLEENQALKNADMVRHFVEIRDGLRQSIKAYNRMLEIVNNPLLDDNRIIEIEPDVGNELKDTGPSRLSEENADENLSAEELLDKIPAETKDLEKEDDVNQ